MMPNVCLPWVRLMSAGELHQVRFVVDQSLLYFYERLRNKPVGEPAQRIGYQSCPEMQPIPRSRVESIVDRSQVSSRHLRDLKGQAPWAWEDQASGVTPYNRSRSPPLVFRAYCTYCTSSGRTCFNCPNVEAGPRNRASGADMQILLANECNPGPEVTTRRSASYRAQVEEAVLRMG